MKKKMNALNPKAAWTILIRAGLLALSVLLICSGCCVFSEAGEATSIPETSGTFLLSPAGCFGSFDGGRAQTLLELINELREEKGLEPYITNEDMRQWAQVRAAEIVVRFEHKRLDGSSVYTAYPGEEGTHFRANIARGYDTAQSALDAWMTKEEIRANIFSETFTLLGTACLLHNDSYYWTLVYLLP